MHAVAEELKLQAIRVGEEDKIQIKADKELLAADSKMAQDTMKHMDASVLKVSAAAAAIESGKIRTKAELDKAIDKAIRADMDRRWLVTDVATWYPVSEEPQHHFTAAVAAYAKKDYRSAAAEIRKASSYLRLESNRASGEGKRELDRSVAQLDGLADSVEKGEVKDRHAMEKDFATANHALAVEHQAKAVESWARKDYNKAGYELKAAAHGLESAADWVGGDAKKGVSVMAADTRSLGDKLTSGAAWTRDEVANGFEALKHSLNELRLKVSGHHQ